MAWINTTNLTQAVAEIKAYCVAAFKPDWNEYDSTSTKYIANRPFYHDYDTDTVLADTAFSTNYADYDITVSGYDYALLSACENVTLAKDITVGTSYHVKAGIGGAYEKDVIAGSSTTYTLNGAGSTKTVTGIPLVVTGYCIIVRTATKKATILLAGKANQYPVTGQTIGIGEVTVDDLQTIDPEFLPAATSSAYGAVKVDTALSAYSHNPVENQAVKTALNDKLDEDDYLAGMTWDYLEAHFTWDDLDGTSTSGSDTYTTNLNLTKPGHLSTAAINNDLDILDTKIGAVGSTSLQSQVTTINSEYVRYSNKRISDITLATTGITTVTTNVICNEMYGVWLSECGVANSYAHHLVLNSWSYNASTSTLTMRFGGDGDTYYPVISMLWR